MIELRKTPRINVNWRVSIQLPDKRLLQLKAMNISDEGILLRCPVALSATSSYPVLLEIPSLQSHEEHYLVSGQGSVIHSILSDGDYRIHLRLSAMSALHTELVQAWVSRVTRKFSVD